MSRKGKHWVMPLRGQFNSVSKMNQTSSVIKDEKNIRRPVEDVKQHRGPEQKRPV